MARWLAKVRLPDAPDRRQAELVADHLHGEDLVRIEAVAKANPPAWRAIVRLPDRKTRKDAEATARELHGPLLEEVLSLAAEETVEHRRGIREDSGEDGA